MFKRNGVMGIKSAFIFLAVFAPLSAFADLKDELQKEEDLFAEAFNRGQVDKIEDAYSEDAKFFPQDGEVLTGRKAIAGWFTQSMGQLTNMRLTILEAEQISDQVAYESGTFTMSTKPQPQQAEQKFAGKYMTLYRKTGNKWLISKDIINLVPVK